ncbi:hypothetical protein PCE1_001523 [Barthelona sp. PCE]
MNRAKGYEIRGENELVVDEQLSLSFQLPISHGACVYSGNRSVTFVDASTDTSDVFYCVLMHTSGRYSVSTFSKPIMTTKNLCAHQTSAVIHAALHMLTESGTYDPETLDEYLMTLEEWDTQPHIPQCCTCYTLLYAHMGDTVYMFDFSHCATLQIAKVSDFCEWHEVSPRMVHSGQNVCFVWDDLGSVLVLKHEFCWSGKRIDSASVTGQMKLVQDTRTVRWVARDVLFFDNKFLNMSDTFVEAALDPVHPSFVLIDGTSHGCDLNHFEYFESEAAKCSDHSSIVIDANGNVTCTGAPLKCVKANVFKTIKSYLDDYFEEWGGNCDVCEGSCDSIFGRVLHTVMASPWVLCDIGEYAMEKEL